MSLDRIGWNQTLEAAFAPFREQGLEAARVAREDRDHYLLLVEQGVRDARLAGRLRHGARSAADLPGVGDWVAARAGAGGTDVIVAVLPRASAFVRKTAGRVTGEQVIAANVDTVFLVTGLDGDFNLRRIERYLAAAWESGASPVIVLNKADLPCDLESRRAEVERAAWGVPVVTLSALTGDGLAALAPWLDPGRTVALIGSSGVGKSTLVNALLGEARQETLAVREDDSRGRHATTRRELVPLAGGAVLLDTPGMRELQLWDVDAGLAAAFPEVAALAEGCRFRDCTHRDEPGCAVRAAADDGRLDAARLENWHKLQREQHWLESRRDARARAAEEARWKAIAKSMKHHPKADRWK